MELGDIFGRETIDNPGCKRLWLEARLCPLDNSSMINLRQWGFKMNLRVQRRRRGNFTPMSVSSATHHVRLDASWLECCPLGPENNLIYLLLILWYFLHEPRRNVQWISIAAECTHNLFVTLIAYFSLQWAPPWLSLSYQTRKLWQARRGSPGEFQVSAEI